MRTALFGGLLQLSDVVSRMIKLAHFLLIKESESFKMKGAFLRKLSFSARRLIVNNKLSSHELSRRQFITKLMPACALTCLGSGSVLALTPAEAKSFLQETKHKFDKEFGRKLTNRQFFAARYGEFIKLAKALEEEMGKDRLIEFLKKNTTENMLKVGQNHAKSSPDNSFRTYVNTFKSPGYKDTLTIEIVEDTEKAFELKITECIWATTFLQAKAGDIGYASVCFGDYAWAEGFNPKIKMVRDKTLMQGKDCCNHRYIWTG